MTCIIGIAKDNRVALGGDSASIANNLLEIRDDPKVFKNGDFLIGFTSSFRMGQLLRFGFIPPIQKIGQDDYDYLCTDFINAVRDRLKQGGYETIDKNVETGGTFIVGYKGRIYKIGDDFQVSIPRSGFTACGCGEEIALGAMAALMKTNINIKEVIFEALKIVETFCAGVRSPFNIIT